MATKKKKPIICEADIKQAAACEIKPEPGVVVSNNNFYGAPIFDASVVQGINDVAKALLNLTELYSTKQISVTMLNVGTPAK